MVQEFILKINKDMCLLLILFLIILHFINAQDGSPYASVPRSIKIVWTGNEYIWRYAVEIDNSEEGVFKHYLQEYTQSTFLNLTILPGIYRYRIIPHDILDRPGDPTEWIDFEIHSALIYDISNLPVEYNNDQNDAVQIFNFDVNELPQALKNEIESKAEIEIELEYKSENLKIIEPEIELDDTKGLIIDNEQLTQNEERINFARFNTVGISLGTSFIDPLLIASVRGTYSPINNLFIEFGFDAGFISIYKNINVFYSLYPYVNLGYFLPFRNKAGIFAGAGAGYMFGSYKFSHGGKADLGFFAANFTIGVNIINAINIEYSLRTDFKAISHKVAVGYVYRFIRRN